MAVPVPPPPALNPRLSPHQVIVRPLVTEKGMHRARRNGAYSFEVVTAPGSTLEGLVLTLKIPDWSRAAALDEWLAAVRSWGFAPEARQLSTGGREVCVVARRGTRPRAARRRGGRQRSIRGGPRRATRRADR